jgi:predicted MFS family arabinose efflux permease
LSQPREAEHSSAAAASLLSTVVAGSRPLGALLGGLLGSVVGLRPALWVATLGGVAGFALLLPTPLPRYRLPAVDGPARA